MCAICGTKTAHLPWTIFLVKTIVITFIYLLAIFVVQNVNKFLQRIQNYNEAPFLGLKWPIRPKEIFFLENYYYHSRLPISPFHCAKLKKKFFKKIYEDVQFMTHFPK